MAREYFKAYHSYLESIEPLGDAERGRLFTALLTYSRTGIVPELQGNERFVFPTLKSNIEREIASYEENSAKNAINGRLRAIIAAAMTWKQRWTLIARACETEKLGPA